MSDTTILNCHYNFKYPFHPYPTENFKQFSSKLVSRRKIMIYIVRKKPHRGLKKSENLPGGGKKEMISRVLESLQLN